MCREKFVSGSLSRKRFQDILERFESSNRQLGDDRNQIRLVDFEGRKLVVKSFKTPNFINKIVYRFFRKSKAARSYENAVYLQAHEIGTPAPVAYLEVHSSLGLYKSYYVSDYMEHDFTYRELINDDTIENKEEVLKQFTQFMYKMHEAQIYFLDNSPGNTLIAKNGNGFDFYLVDLNRMKFYDIPIADRLKNFERLSPEKWMYEIMGTEYARLAGEDAAATIEKMWRYTQEFQKAFLKKRQLKKKLKATFKK